jgi:DNA-directed RNA polymerase specialized sigma24 family protein
MTPHAKDIDDRLSAKWALEQFDDACLIIRDELIPIIRDDLLARAEFTLSYEDAEDIVQEAFQAFCVQLRRYGGRRIACPRAYLWRSAINRSIRKSQENKTEPRVEFFEKKNDSDLTFEDWLDHEHYKSHPAKTFGWDERAKFIIEGVFESEDITAAAAAKVMKVVISRVDPNSAAILECLLDYGPSQSAALGGERLGITSKLYRVRKFRVYKKLKEIVPPVAAELEVKLLRYDPESESEPEVYMFEDSDLGGAIDDPL